MQSAVGLPQKRENLVFMFQTGCFFLYALFQYRITFGQFFRHIIERRTQRGHLIASTDIGTLGKVALTDGARH
ncbi:Uncharacterised protein [Salmonella enterica subsp. enterica serovar Typhimurium str. DT104]|nr:Uncharacterised protein [Salmonella enterica subsp. enterica serovar Typhimurium str. DT104]CQN90466.1 Uncharacterised protein [Salmonella enterica subsp. enterica serovar Typhimurium str. DT104]VFS85339.1 Uncharacterised protein [Salmonella enterica subsp. enterica]